MDFQSYFIAVEVPATGPIEKLTKALEKAFAPSPGGKVKVIVSTQPSYIALFCRSTADLNHKVLLREQMARLDCTVEEAAMLQLAAELTGAVGRAGKPVLEELRNLDAQVVDFANSLESV